jgi:SulP family sulfate permease
MNVNAATAATISKPGFIELFTPKLVTILREGYTLANFRSDVIAGLTVAIVALPLSMAIAIASGASPAQGLYTSIVGGFLVSALGGSRFQIGGPAGAFIVLVAATVMQHGMDGLILATILAGLMLIAIGLLRIGTYIKFIPYPVTVGFTAGIAVIIFASQVKDLLGLTLGVPEPGPLLQKLPVLWMSLHTITSAAVAISFATIAIIGGLKQMRPHWPGMLIAVAATSIAASMAGLPISTIGTAFGGIPTGVPLPALPDATWAKISAVFPNAAAFALLGSIESLLSAVVADGMTGRRHRSNCELVGQGIANVASGLFGGICVTGTIARTATNVRAGAHGPIAGMMHAVFLLIFILVAAPLASYIPLASLAGVLAIVAWNMVEKHAFLALIRSVRGDALVLMTTFLLTVFRDLTEGIIVGFGLGSVIFIHRMSKTTAIETSTPFVAEDKADRGNGDRTPYDKVLANDKDVLIYRISGVFFFGAAASIGSVLDRIAETRSDVIVDLSGVPFIDSTAAETIKQLAHKAKRRSLIFTITGTTHDMRLELFMQGLKPPLVHYETTIEKALKDREMRLASK